MPITVLRPLSGVAPPTPPPPTTDKPSVTAEIAFATNPGDTPTYTDVSAYLRNLSTARGRSWEYDRAEAGNAAFTLDNRDSRFNPENSSTGPYYPNLKPTRRCRLRAVWDSNNYDLMVGFTKGYPQQFPSMGFDALVQQQASDLFYRLNMTKFRPGSTTLAASIDTAPATDTVETVTVTSTELPMPQALPFTVTVDEENMQVTAILSATQWTVKRAQDQTFAAVHANGATVTTLAVSFGEELSGTRIRNVLERAGITTGDMEVGDGVSLISPSQDLAGQNMLQHVQEIAEAENGRLFVSRSGRFTFRDRHWILQNERVDRSWFSDAAAHDALYASETTLAGETTLVTDGDPVIPYSLPGPVEHDESKLANVVRVTPTSGNTKTATDQASVDENFERVLEKDWPLASDIDAQGAAEWMLLQLKDAKLRIPAVTVHGARNPAVLWPILLGMEIGQRYGFQYTPKGGGDSIVRSVIVEGIRHEISPSDHVVTVELSPADTTVYWRLGITGYSELGDTTRMSY